MIVVFGSINADLVISVDVHPQPGQTVSGTDYQVLPGGKGANQALAASRSGSQVAMVGAIGADDFGTQALINLEGAGVDLSHVRHFKGTSGVAFIVIDAQGENTIVVTPGANAELRADALASISHDVLVTQNEIVPERNWAAHALARKSGAKVVHNAAPAAPIGKQNLRQIDYLIVNESEATLVASALGFEGGDPQQAVRFIQNISGNSVVATLGAQGAFAIGPEGAFDVPALAVDVVDTTGAGDAFVGAFTSAIDRDFDFKTAVERGVIAGSLACRSLGAQASVPTEEEISAHRIS